jgi:site-specific DNA-cytosine methylase
MGFDAWSCDLEPSEDPSQRHIEDDVLTVMMRGKWDLLIAHPPCTDLAASGAWKFAEKGDRPTLALEFVKELMAAPIPRIAIENPIGLLSTNLRKPDQIVQPWWFGHREVKATCLWLKGLPKLRATNPVIAFESKIYAMTESPTRAKDRSRTYEGVALAMAEQWGPLLYDARK